MSSEVCEVEHQEQQQSGGDSPAAMGNGTLNPVRGEHSELNTKRPIHRGQITDWEAMEDVWRYMFYEELGWEIGNEGNVLVTEPLCTPKVCSV